MKNKKTPTEKKRYIFFYLVLIIAAFINVSSASAICGDKIKDSGEECDFDPEIGPYPSHCPSNGACDWATCKCEVCVPNCDCATNLCSNSNCSDGCGGTCTGKKACTDGKCGTADGKFTATIPTANLCSSGTASVVTGSGPWSWTCQGIDGGKDVNCETGNEGSKYYDYVPAYFDEVEYIYCSNKSSIDGVAGKKDTYPCDPINNNFVKNYQYTKTYSGGFREKFNPNNPIIAYRTDELSGEEAKTSYISFSLQMQNPAYPNGNKLNPKIFNNGNALDSRLYFPPGLMGLLLKIQPTQGSGGQSIMGRFGQPPVTDFPPGSSHEEWKAYIQNYTQYQQYFPPEVYSSGMFWVDVENVRLRDYKKYDLLTFQYGGNDHVAISPFYANIDGPPDYEEMTDEGGWLYMKFKDWGESDPLGYRGYWAVDIKTYTKWYNCMEEKDGWDSNGDPKEGFTACDPSAIQSGPDCAQKTCQGNSCWNDTKWIPGTRTEGCATGEAKATPDRLTNVGKSFITWSSQGASEMELDCSGSVPLTRGEWYISGEKCYDAGQYCELNGDEKGYPLTLGEDFFNQGKEQEICTFYPTNESDGQPGTPFSFTINLTEDTKSICGNNIIEEGEGCDYQQTSGTASGTLCPTGKICKDCKCVTSTDTNKYVCQPDDSACAKSTCKDVKCFDGCNYQQGLKDCEGRE